MKIFGKMCIRDRNRPVDVLTIREKYIYRAIRGLLFKKQVRYYLKTESERELVIDRENENMPYQIEIKIASEHCLVLQFHYPFRVQMCIRDRNYLELII